MIEQLKKQQQPLKTLTIIIPLVSIELNFSVLVFLLLIFLPDLFAYEYVWLFFLAEV